jgi:hypothetical protein
LDRKLQTTNAAAKKQLIADDAPRLVDDEERQDAEEDHDRDGRAAGVEEAAEQHARGHDGREGQIQDQPDAPQLPLLDIARAEKQQARIEEQQPVREQQRVVVRPEQAGQEHNGGDQQRAVGKHHEVAPVPAVDLRRAAVDPLAQLVQHSAHLPCRFGRFAWLR